MPPHPQVLQYLAQRYPKPKVDEEWLQSCYDWVVEEKNLDPTRDIPEILKQVEAQLLGSDLHDSMQPNTGLARNIGTAKKGATGAIPTLVQIISITEIGHSAFSLLNTRQTRLDRADLAGLAEEDGGEDDGPIPKYSRSMLKFQLSDGHIIINACEYRKIPQLSLDETPLGYKIQLTGVRIRRGIALLEPSNVTLMGGSVEDLDANRDSNFERSLRLRMNPDTTFEDDEERLADMPAQPVAQIAAAPNNPGPDATAQQAAMRAQLTRQPIRQIQPLVPAPAPAPAPPLRQQALPYQRQPKREPTPPPAAVTSATSSTAVPTKSPYFSSTTTTPSPSQKIYSAEALALARRLSPTHGNRSFIDVEALPDSDEEEATMQARETEANRASSDYGDTDVDMYNDDVFVQLDEAERRANVPSQKSARNHQPHPPRATQSRAPSRTQARTVTPSDGDVIEIPTDDEEENVPPPTQRRRAIVRHGTVIELD